MNKIRKASLIAIFSFISTFLLAQDAEMADTMRSEGKIYVVVAILLVILVGLLAYVFLTDRKISGLEQKINEKKAKARFS